jgi:hypothetical protein
MKPTKLLATAHFLIGLPFQPHSFNAPKPQNIIIYYKNHLQQKIPQRNTLEV